MKALIYLIAVFPYLASAQSGVQDSLFSILPLKDRHVQYSEVVMVDGVTKEELFNRAKRWIVDTYKSAKDVAQLDDAANGEIVGKGNFKTYWQSSFISGEEVRINHTIRIAVKDGKYRYEITDFVVSGFNPSSKYTRGGPWEQSLEHWATERPQNTKKFFRQSVVPYVSNLITSLEAGMLKPVANSDW